MDQNSKFGFEENAFVDKEVKEKRSKMEVKHSIRDGIKAEKMKSSVVARLSPSLACFKFWAIVTTTMLLLQWVSRVQWETLDQISMVQNNSPSYPYPVPPERVYENNGYLMISCNGGLNQMRNGICDMVAIARYLNVTLIVPELDNTSYWNDQSQFADLFDVDYFITSLRDEIRILKELPPEEKRRVESESLYSMYPYPWSSLTYYHDRILPRIKMHNVLHFTLTDARLANNGLPEELQKLRCRVSYEALRFTSQIEETGRKIVRLVRQNGPFLALHLRYEKDILAFSGCTEGFSKEEIEELTNMRYSHPGWKHSLINSERKRKFGSCPLTPDETALTLKALDIDPNTQIYIAGGEIYGGERRMASLAAAFPNLVRKETLLELSDLRPFQNHSNQMAALDYIVALESDIFFPTYRGNMATLVEGNRRYLGFRTTIIPNRALLPTLIDQYKNGTLSWDQFSLLVKAAHENRMGKPTRRLEIPGHPKLEGYFYSNPQECLPPITEP